MKLRRGATATLLFLWGGLGLDRWALAQGGPPMITDDPGTPGSGHWEINLATTGRHGASASELELPLIDINYGLGERLQLKYEVPWVTVHEENESSRSGLGSSLFGVKWRFFDAGDAGWQVSVYPQIELRNPGSHSAARGLAEEGTQVLLPFQLQRAFSWFDTNFEIGREFHSEAADEWMGGVVIGHRWSDTVEGMIEVHANWDGPLEHSAVAINVGARVAVGDAGTLLLSMGSDVHNALEERALVLGYVGWQIAL